MNNMGKARSWATLWGALIVLALVLAACSGDDDDATATSGDDGGALSFDGSSGDDGAESAPEPEPASEPEGEEELADTGRVLSQDDAAEEPADGDDGEGGGGDGGGDDVEAPQRPATNRSIIFIATVDVVVDDVTMSASLAKNQIAGLGGLVFGEETSVGAQARTTLEFKVLPEDFDEALRRLEGLGELRAQTITADDVTERVVDLQSRITTSQASVDRLRGFLEQAGTLEDIAELELQLLQRETDLELLRGQLRTVQDQVSLATIFLTLTEPAPPAPAEVEALGEVEVSFLEGAEAGDRCPGVDELSVDEGNPFTVCVEITNTGTNPMVDIEIRDNPLDLSPRDFTFVEGDDAEPLAPGDSTIAWASTNAPANGRSNVKVSASAAEEDGTSLRRAVDFFQPEEAEIRFVEDDSLPGFGDALSGSANALVTALSIAALVVAAIIPFVWIIPLAWVVHRLWRRWTSRRHEYVDDREDVPPPPGPASATNRAQD